MSYLPYLEAGGRGHLVTPPFLPNHPCIPPANVRLPPLPSLPARNPRCVSRLTLSGKRGSPRHSPHPLRPPILTYPFQDGRKGSGKTRKIVRKISRPIDGENSIFSPFASRVREHVASTSSSRVHVREMKTARRKSEIASRGGRCSRSKILATLRPVEHACDLNPRSDLITETLATLGHAKNRRK